MIKLFRKISKKIIAENSSIIRNTNYLKYALGEIVLVVIGILIALQINNWNEISNKKSSAKLHLETISKNIKEDLLQLKDLYNFTNSSLKYSKKLTRQFQTLDSIDENTTLFISALLLEKSLSPNKSGLETLNNSGELAYIPKQTQELLLKYYNVLDNIAAREEISNTFIKFKYEPHFFKHYSFTINKDILWLVAQEYYKDDPRNSRKIDQKSFLADEALEAMVFGRHFQIAQQNALYKNAIEIANKLLKTLN
jgi:hypothetical protein